MKEFLAISSNQITKPDTKRRIILVQSEIIISTAEPEYGIMNDENGKADLFKTAKTETVRFFASTEQLMLLSDSIKKEIENHRKTADMLQIKNQ